MNASSLVGVRPISHAARLPESLRLPSPQPARPPDAEAVPPNPQMPGLSALWNITKGDPRVTIAVIDGPVDASHPCFAGASLQTLPLKGQAPRLCRSRSQGSCNHGTQIASLLFAQHGCGPVWGIAPRCRGLVIPVFRDHPFLAGGILPASQTDLARAIDLARERGAQIINISSGQLSPRGQADPQLAAAVRRCVDQGVLIVSAAGNDGSDAVHVPAALPGVLVVGALDRAGKPADFSNFGSSYLGRGILAPGENLRVASNGGGFGVQSGTSFATPLVSGVAALLLSARYRAGQCSSGLRPSDLRDVLLKSARGCTTQDPAACRRLLAGTLDVERALALLGRGEPAMTTPNSPDQMPVEDPDAPVDAGAVADSATGEPEPAQRRAPFSGAQPGSGGRARQAGTGRAQVMPSCKGEGGCSCGGGGGEKCSCGGGSSEQERAPLVYALGTLSYDFGTQARFDSIAAEIIVGEQPTERRPRGEKGKPRPNEPPAPRPVGPIPASIDTFSLLNHLEDAPFVAESIIWTLNLDATPIYAIRPDGAYAAQTYDRLRQFLAEQVDEKVRAERVAIPGYVIGTQTLLTGQKVGVIAPEIRGMANWTTGALVEALLGKRPDEKATKQDRENFQRKEEGFTNFLHRVYFEVRNMGLEPRDRALNYAATNAMEFERVFEAQARAGRQLDQIDVERSPVCRLDSDCWDVVLYFFNPEDVLGEARRAVRLTIDVSDVVPVAIGDIREWAVR